MRDTNDDTDEQYGGPIEVRREDGWVRMVHTGPDLHDEVPPGKQCRCGWMNIGIVET